MVLHVSLTSLFTVIGLELYFTAEFVGFVLFLDHLESIEKRQWIYFGVTKQRYFSILAK